MLAKSTSPEINAEIAAGRRESVSVRLQPLLLEITPRQGGASGISLFKRDGEAIRIFFFSWAKHRPQPADKR
jgi:hypothetical protein